MYVSKYFATVLRNKIEAYSLWQRHKQTSTSVNKTTVHLAPNSFILATSLVQVNYRMRLRKIAENRFLVGLSLQTRDILRLTLFYRPLSGVIEKVFKNIRTT